jgi:NAD kinase
MNFLLVYQQGFPNLLDEIKNFLSSHKITTRERESLKPALYENKDLVVVLGGDGTFLRASHYNKDVSMFGINPQPDRKEGYYMQATYKNYQELWNKVEKLKTKQLLRLSVKINGDKIGELALNDIYIGDAKPYNMFNYDINVGKTSEFQRSSGVLIGTPSGSSGWIGSAGLEISQQDKFGFVARELYRGELTPDYKLEKGLVDRGQTIEIKAKTSGIVVLDSVSEEYKLGEGSKVEISVSSYPLQYIVIK